MIVLLWVRYKAPRSATDAHVACESPITDSRVASFHHHCWTWPNFFPLRPLKLKFNSQEWTVLAMRSCGLQLSIFTACLRRQRKIQQKHRYQNYYIMSPWCEIRRQRRSTTINITLYGNMNQGVPASLNSIKFICPHSQTLTKTTRSSIRSSVLTCQIYCGWNSTYPDAVNSSSVLSFAVQLAYHNKLWRIAKKTLQTDHHLKLKVACQYPGMIRKENMAHANVRVVFKLFEYSQKPWQSTDGTIRH